jgi:hypothetical protein
LGKGNETAIFNNFSRINSLAALMGGDYAGRHPPDQTTGIGKDANFTNSYSTQITIGAQFASYQRGPSMLSRNNSLISGYTGLKNLVYVNYSQGTGQIGAGDTNFGIQVESFVQDVSLMTPGATETPSSSIRLGQDLSVNGTTRGRAIWAIKGEVFFEPGVVIYAGGIQLAFTGSHSGLYSKSEIIQQGDIVLDTSNVIQGDMNNAVSIITKSTAPMQKASIGVFNKDDNFNIPFPLRILSTSTSNVYHEKGIVTTNEMAKHDIVDPQYEELILNNNICSINALGEGLINVCGENGNLEIGDYITTSSIPGKGMKQSDDLMRNYTVAKSRENITFSSPTEVKLVACTYHCG